MLQVPIMELSENLLQGCDQLSVSEQEITSSQAVSVPVMELGENLPKGCDQLTVLEQEITNSQSLSDMLVSSRPDLCYFEDACITEETSMWPTTMGFTPAITSSTTAAVAATTTTTTTNAASASFPATVKRPLTNAFSGQFQFDIQPTRHPEDNHWVYSQLLDKVFTDRGKSVRFNVTLRADWTPSTALFIRALPLFLPETDSFEEVVKTCPTHEDVAHSLNAGCPSVKHVVRCSDPQAQYQTDPVSGRHSVVTRLSAPQPGAPSIPLLYSFVCKNSCRGGIGRRALALVFTLEDISGEILGRRVLEVRICSCPPRDKRKQEEQYLRNHSREQSEQREQLENIKSETKVFIQQLVQFSKSESMQEVPESQVFTEEHMDSTQRCDNIPLKLSGCIIGSQHHVEFPVMLDHQRGVMRQAMAVLCRDAVEKQVSFAESDSLLLQIYREDC